MEKAIKLLSLVDEFNFIDLFIVISSPAEGIHDIKSVVFLSREEAQKHCNYLNKKYNTNKYRVFKTEAHI